MVAGRSLRGITFPVLFYKDVDKRTDKGNTASGAYIDAHLVVEICPVDMWGIEFLKEQESKGTHVANEIDGDDEEAHIAFDFKTRDEAFKEYGLETQVGNVQAETLQEKPDGGGQGYFVEVSS